MADEGTSDVDSGLLDPQLSPSDELLLDQDDLGEDQAAIKKTGEEIPNLEDDDPVSVKTGRLCSCADMYVMIVMFI